MPDNTRVVLRICSADTFTSGTASGFSANFVDYSLDFQVAGPARQVQITGTPVLSNTIIRVNGRPATGTDSITGVIMAVKQGSGNLLANNACSAVADSSSPNNVKALLTHARSGVAGTSSDQVTHASTFYRSVRLMTLTAFPAIVVTGLTKNTAYTMALCSVNASSYRGGGSMDALVQNVMTTNVGVAVLYRQFENTDGNFLLTSCLTGAPSQVSTTNFTGHTLFGAVPVTNGGFHELPARLGGTNPGSYEVRVLHGGSIHAPSTATTLDELLASMITRHPLLGTDIREHTNTAQVKNIFRLLNNGSETTVISGSKRYWTLSDINGNYDNFLLDIF